MYEAFRKILTTAGEQSLRYYGNIQTENIAFKSEADLVTQADKEVEESLRTQLREYFPEAKFVGEESSPDSEKGTRFVVDPIDGTTGFVHGLPYYAISVALQESDGVRAGGVYLPVFEDFYFAEKDKGAWKNGSRIQVSPTDQLVNALGATGFACVRQRHTKNNLPIFCHVLPHLRGIRRFGSAAADLCLVAEGKLDLFWEMNLEPWDYAAGAFILTEAEGKVTDFQNGSALEERREIVATNGLLHEDLLSLINSAS